MRNLLFAASAIACAVPAAAQDLPPPPGYEADYIDVYEDDLPAPGEIADMGDRIGRVAGAIMDVPVGPVVEAVDPGRRLSRRERERTLGDLASRDDPYARERVRDSIDAATIGLSVALQRLAALTPVLERAIDDAERSVDDAMRDRPARPYRDDRR